MTSLVDTFRCGAALSGVCPPSVAPGQILELHIPSEDLWLRKTFTSALCPRGVVWPWCIFRAYAVDDNASFHDLSSVPWSASPQRFCFPVRVFVVVKAVTQSSDRRSNSAHEATQESKEAPADAGQAALEAAHLGKVVMPDLAGTESVLSQALSPKCAATPPRSPAVLASTTTNPDGLFYPDLWQASAKAGFQVRDPSIIVDRVDTAACPAKAYPLSVNR